MKNEKDRFNKKFNQTWDRQTYMAGQMQDRKNVRYDSSRTGKCKQGQRKTDKCRTEICNADKCR